MGKRSLLEISEQDQTNLVLFRAGIETLLQFKNLLGQLGDLPDQFKLEEAKSISTTALRSIQESGVDIFALLPNEIDYATLFQFGPDKAVRIHRMRDGQKPDKQPSEENTWDFFTQVIPEIQRVKPEYIVAR